MRLIDVDDAIEKINCLCVDGNENWIGTENQSFVDHADVIDILSSIPTVDAVPIVEGKLEQYTKSSWRCNMCGRLHDLGSETPEEARMICCSSCGAVYNMTAYMSMRKAVEGKKRRENDA